MPGNRMAPSLAESWTESPDKLTSTIAVYGNAATRLVQYAPSTGA
jgi:hypothetical protein